MNFLNNMQFRTSFNRIAHAKFSIFCNAVPLMIANRLLALKLTGTRKIQSYRSANASSTQKTQNMHWGHLQMVVGSLQTIDVSVLSMVHLAISDRKSVETIDFAYQDDIVISHQQILPLHPMHPNQTANIRTSTSIGIWCWKTNQVIKVQNTGVIMPKCHPQRFGNRSRTIDLAVPCSPINKIGDSVTSAAKIGASKCSHPTTP